MSNQPPYGYPPPPPQSPPGGGQPGYPPPGGGYPPQGGGGYPGGGGYQGGGGYGYGGGGGGYPPQGPQGKTKTMSLDYNVAGLLCYIPCCIGLIFSIIFVATEPRESRFVRFHSFQGLFLTGIGVILNIVFYILGNVVWTAPTASAAIGMASILWLIQVVVGLGFLVLHIIAMVKAYGNQMWKIPIIGGLAESNA